MRAHCIALFACWLLACGADSVGAGCNETTPCATPLICAPTETMGASACMRACDIDPATGVSQRLCDDGSTCLGADGARVCYLGGRSAYGTMCLGELACEAGTVCSPDLSLCEQACSVGDDRPCDDGEVCTDVAGGVCRRIAGAECSDAHPCTTGLACVPSVEQPTVVVCM